jgi:peptidoglycan/xylan/chitin deacetylase (PgdA/CDA1 family)
MRRLLVIFALGLYLSHSGKLPSARKQNYRIPVLCYHDIRTTPKSSFAITPQTFEMQLQWLQKNNYRAITLEQLYQHLLAERPFDYKAVLITFDDGFPSLRNHVMPILQRYKMPAVFFIYTDRIRTERSDRQFPARFLGWQDIRNMKRAGFEVQSHSVHHIRMDRTNNPMLEMTGQKNHPGMNLYQEFTRSYELLQKKIRPAGGRIYAFAFPYGVFNRHLASQARAAGYRLLFSTDHKPARIGIDHKVVGRYTITQKTTMAEFQKFLQQ